jgi:hypothetical protein
MPCSFYLNGDLTPENRTVPAEKVLRESGWKVVQGDRPVGRTACGHTSRLHKKLLLEPARC